MGNEMLDEGKRDLHHGMDDECARGGGMVMVAACCC
jgi:hypothetical protein